MPSLGAAENPAIDRPGNATESTIPGTCSAISLICRITASVRSSDAPAGNWAMPIRYCLSGAGTNPEGMRVNRNAVSAEQHRVDDHRDRLALQMPVTPRP